MKRDIKTALVAIAFSLGIVHAQQSDLYGVIEIGSSGIKPLVLQALPVTEAAEPPPAGTEIEPYRVREKMPTIDDNAMNEEAAAKTTADVLATIETMRRQYSVPASQIYVVGSSGLAAQPSKAVVEKKVNEGLPAEAPRMEFISAEDEATLAFQGVMDRLPPYWRAKRYPQVLFLDIGSGNMRGAYVTRTKPFTIGTFEIPWGTKTFGKKVDATRGEKPFVAAAEELRKTEVVAALRSASQRFPGLQNINRVYLAGGASYALTTLLHPDKQSGDFVPLKPGDIETFHRKATTDAASLMQPDFDSFQFASKEAEARAREDIERIMKTIFSGNQIVSAADLLLALNNEFDIKHKTVFFARSALYAWPMGYLARKIKGDSAEN